MRGLLEPDRFAKFSQDIHGVIGRAVIDDDYFFVRPRLVQRALHRGGDPLGGVMARDAYGYEGWHEPEGSLWEDFEIRNSNLETRWSRRGRGIGMLPGCQSKRHATERRTWAHALPS